ncbi:MAG TPA: Gfo/Idh/MocA family oxidoreductase [Gemmatimonadaceae bacterium]|nr:Gfo/Idh/MocA family oxidoreductase [Gemmatimonadaceae bacterium]
MTSEPPLRVAIVGAGKMGQHHARAVARAGGTGRVVAIVDPAPAAREAMLQICPEAAAFSTLDEALAAGGIELVHVCTAPHTHEALAARALGAGCHVYVEKPFVESSHAAQRLLALAEERGLYVCAGHQLLYEPPARRMVELLPALGDLVHVESFFSFRTVRRAPGGRVPLAADQQLLDILPHPIYLLLYALEVAAPEARTEITAIEVGPAGTVHALVRRGRLTASLVVTLEGRPIESYLRLVGTNGTVHADFVRGTVQRFIGPGTSGIDKALNPFRHGWQLLGGTAAALGGRIVRRQRSYPGLAELFEAFYRAIRSGGAPPLSPDSILETTRIWEQIAAALRADEPEEGPDEFQAPALDAGPRVLVTGGTGFLGKEVARAVVLRGGTPRVVSRRSPAAWERLPGVEYVRANLADGVPPEAMRGVDVVIHCAAETAGGWEEHQRNSIDAVEHLMRAAADAGVRKVIHVSSLAVLGGGPRGVPLSEGSPLEPQTRARGPYVWGKLESERLAERLGHELGIETRIVRPGALIDSRAFEPPGRLGKRVGNTFVAVGSPRETLGVVDVRFAAEVLSWMAERFDEAPVVLNLLDPVLPARRDLVARLRQNNPDLTVVWLPTFALVPLSWLAVGLQKLLRPGKPAMHLAKVFASEPYSTERVAQLASRLRRPDGELRPPRAEHVTHAGAAAPRS